MDHIFLKNICLSSHLRLCPIAKIRVAWNFHQPSPAAEAHIEKDSEALHLSFSLLWEYPDGTSMQVNLSIG
jgi:hypothetical protein